MDQLGQFIINHWQLWLALVVILLLIFINEFISQRQKSKQVSPQQLVDLINNENALIIDIRETELFKKGHISQSINAKAEDFSTTKMDKFKGKEMVLVCSRGIQASTLAQKLSKQGFQPTVLAGGIEAWSNADLPLVKGK